MAGTYLARCRRSLGSWGRMNLAFHHRSSWFASVWLAIEQQFIPSQGGGGKVPYPKHVWSPAGGWYAQPANWRGNTIIAGGVMFAIVLCTWKFSAERETWAHNPEPGSWYPSRRWSKQLVQFDKEQRLKSEGKE
ncbi:hypothetical protein S7711_00739 [Stachybotrys chartarum IBT 7711]|uniref:Uncharacterized protein n=1 Tax=Stachybotrys chartarum (strain CBS 109288 / IBT 7711) TaxID=1280523 RepID=A0A084B017_STACB|nr:hypothetical protein S7711_00739 [Stachybotrys chartarum IBT 7711]